jgi:hypothetical protein
MDDRGKIVLHNAAAYLVKSSKFGYHVNPQEDPEYYRGDCEGVVTEAERPIFDALHLLACLSQDRDPVFVNFSTIANWLLDEAKEEDHVPTIHLLCHVPKVPEEPLHDSRP